MGKPCSGVYRYSPPAHNGLFGGRINLAGKGVNAITAYAAAADHRADDCERRRDRARRSPVPGHRGGNRSSHLMSVVAALDVPADRRRWTEYRCDLYGAIILLRFMV